MAGAANDVIAAGKLAPAGKAIAARRVRRAFACHPGRNPAATVLAVVALPVVVLAGCGRGGDGLPEPTPPADTGGPSVAPVDVSPDYPTTVEDYAQLTVAAWAAPDPIRLAELTTPDVHRQIMGLPGPPDLDWTFVGCSGDRGSPCTFYNAAGDALVVTVDDALLGEPRATVAAEYEATSYPDDLEPYVAQFVAAWQSGNLARMDNLAVSAVVEVFADLPTAPLPSPPGAVPPSPSVPASPSPPVAYEVGGTSGGLTHVRVTVDGRQISTRVSTALLGEQHAIRSATLRPVT